MPLKRKTRTAVARKKRAFVLKNDTLDPRAVPLITALKENNRCLATALGKYLCKLGYQLTQAVFTYEHNGTIVLE